MSACHSGERCVAYDRTTNTAAWVDRCPLCDDCLTISARDISRLAADHTDLDAHLWPDQLGQHLDGQPIAHGERPIPIAGHVDALQREIVHSVTTWEEILADRISAAPTGRLSAAVTLLNTHVRVLACIEASEATVSQLRGCEDPWVAHSGVDAITHLRRLHRRTLAVTGITTDTRDMPGHCPNPRCARMTLRHDNGSDQVYCARCGKVQTLDDYDRYGNAFLRGAA